MTRRNGRPEIIRSGGFQGGVQVQPSRDPQAGQGLLQLASALGGFQNSAMSALGARQDVKLAEARMSAAEKKALQKKQQEETKQQVELYKARMTAYTSQQMGEFFDTPGMAEKFKQYPDLLPALNKHRGKVRADETAFAMIDAGVPIDDPGAVNAYLEQHGIDTEDPFIAAGFNEQLDRRRADFAQKALTTKIEQADSERLNAAVSELDTVMADTGNAETALKVLRSSRFALNGIEQNEAQVSWMRAAAARGEYENVVKMAEASRGDAPSLIKDANLRDDVQSLINSAKAKKEEIERDGHITNRTALKDWIDAGVNRRSLEDDDRFKAMDATMQGQVIDYWRARQKERQKKQEKANSMAARGQIRKMLTQDALEKVVTGRGEFVRGVTLQDPITNTEFTVTRTQQIGAAIDTFRDSVFGDNFLKLEESDLENYRQYTRRLTDSGLTDKILKDHLNGFGAHLSPEALLEDTSLLESSFQIYKHLDNDVAHRYVSDTQTRAVLEKMNTLAGNYPSKSVDEIARLAVTSVNTDKPRVSLGTKQLKKAVGNIEIEDPLNKAGGVFGFLRGNKKLDADEPIARNWINTQATEYMAWGSTSEEAIKMAAEDYKASHTVVNGRIVQLPSLNSAISEETHDTPESWAKVADSYLKGLAREEGVEDASGYTMYKQDDVSNAYIVVRPDGTTKVTVAAAIKRGGQVALLENERIAAEKERKEAAEKAHRKGQRREDQRIRNMEWD